MCSLFAHTQIMRLVCNFSKIILKIYSLKVNFSYFFITFDVGVK